MQMDLQNDVRVLTVEIGERNMQNYSALRAAEDFIYTSFKAAGLKPKRQTYRVQGKEVANIEVEIKGETDRIVVVGAHYDSVRGCPGANDNGSGIASLLALARHFAGKSLAKTLRFVAFVNEEPPYFQSEEMGSFVYAREAHSKREAIEAMIALETMGYFSSERGSQKYPMPLQFVYPDVGDFIALVSNRASGDLLETVARAFTDSKVIPIQTGKFFESLPGVAWSDHWAFWKFGYPALMITDTAPFRYPYYHTAQDTADKIDYEKLALVTKGLIAALAKLTAPRASASRPTQSLQ